MDIIDQLSAAAELGKGELRGVYQDLKRGIKTKAQYKRQQAKSRIQAAKVKAEEALEMADLEAAMYQAEINAQNAQERAKQLRQQAGHYTFGERLEEAGRGAVKIGGAFIKGLMTSDKSARRKSTKRSSATKRRSTSKVASVQRKRKS